MNSIDRVVWRGDFIRTDKVPLGPLVYRNDMPFLEQRDWIIRLQWLAIVTALSALIFYLIAALALVTVTLVFLWIVFLVIDVAQLNMWRDMDRGIVVHENGLDALDYRHFTVGRIFVPWDEISHFGFGRIRFNIYLKHSNKKLFCHKRMVDGATVWHIWRFLETASLVRGSPELVVYGEEGVSISMPVLRT